MKHEAYRRIGWAAVLLAVAAPVAVYSYSLLSPARHWEGAPIQISVLGSGHASVTSPDPDRGVTATIEALNGNHPYLPATGWNDTAAGPVVQAVASNGAWVLGDGVPTIAFDEKIKGTCTGSCLAATFTGYYDCSTPLPDGHCVIDDADIETRRNKADKFGGPYYSLYEPCTPGKEWNLEAIMVHEVGHVLGIGHSNVGGATMYPSVSSCSSDLATIAGDDAAALNALYPP